MCTRRIVRHNQSVCAVRNYVGGGDDLQKNLQKELESKLSKFRKDTFKPSATDDVKLFVAE